MATLSRWLAPAVLAAGFGLVALSPAPARAQSGDDLVRVLVDVADVVLRGGTAYDRNGNYGYDDRLIVSKFRAGRKHSNHLLERTRYRCRILGCDSLQRAFKPLPSVHFSRGTGRVHDTIGHQTQHFPRRHAVPAEFKLVARNHAQRRSSALIEPQVPRTPVQN